MLIGGLSAKTGLFALEDVDLFNILCVPAAALRRRSTTRAATRSSSEDEAYCDERRAFLLVDIPAASNDPPDDAGVARAKHATLRDRNAAVYFPRPLIPDPLNGCRLRNVGASGTIAGLYARTDASARRLEGAGRDGGDGSATFSELAYLLTEPRERGAQPARHQLPAHLPDLRHASPGARARWTAPTSWRPSGSTCRSGGSRCSSRRACTAGRKWVVFEPNDEPLWAQIRLNVGAFMHDLFRQGAFQGTIAARGVLRQVRRARRRRRTTSTTAIVNILVGFAPLKPAEFVIIKIQQIAGQIQT